MTTAADPVQARVLDYALDSLVWCRDHLDNKQVSLKLRELEIVLASVSLAADQQMEGKIRESREALRHADWSQRRPSRTGTPYECW
jgi:hypothetical protein